MAFFQAVDMNPIKYFILFFSTVYFISCSPKTQVYETKSNIPLDQRKSQYVFDNDTIRIEYNFWANKGLLSYRIYNKLNVPVYIDWKKSSFILNGQKLDYWMDETITHTSGYSYGAYLNLWISESSSIAIKPQRVLFLAPQSYINAHRFIICPGASPVAGGGNPTDIAVPGIPGRSIHIKEHEYDESASPLIFRNYLTYSLSEQLSAENYINNVFYVSKVLEMKRMDFFNRTVDVHNTVTHSSTFINPSFFYVNL